MRLSLESRIDWKTLAGSNPWIRVAVNENFLTKQDLLNKRDEFRLQGGIDGTWSRGDRWRVLYSPDFEQAVKDVNHPHACPGGDPYRYVWNITPYVQPGKNRLLIDNLQVLAKPTTLVLRNVQFEVGRPQSPPPEEAVSPVPTGPLPRFIVRGPQWERKGSSRPGRDVSAGRTARPPEVYVVNAEGKRVPTGMGREIIRNGRRLCEIRMPGDHFAILVRHP